VPLENVTVELGDSLLPPAPVAGGSNTTASVTNAALKAREAMVPELAAGRMGLGPQELQAAMKQAPSGAIEEYAEWIPEGLPGSALKDLYKGKVAITGGTRLKDRVQFAFGRNFLR
jgi:xanthine dehydrogenase YagR molybdenum-binding subunit